jgi:hypothetical protein
MIAPSRPWPAVRVFWAVLSSLFALTLLSIMGFEAYALALARRQAGAELPQNFGNFERVRAPLERQQERGDFAFGVIGDPHGSETFVQIMSRLEHERLSFAAILGDLMEHPTREYHRCVMAEIAQDTSAPFPVFYVMGNHDVDEQDFPVSEFEKTYGPSNFWFSHRGCLFIVLRIVDKPLGPYTLSQSLRFLESVLAEQRARHEKVFILQHFPPPVSADFRARDYEGAAEEIRLCDRYRVDYVITGDFHGYARVKLRNTVYLITGGGGGRLTTRTFGRLHHAVVFNVGRESVSERILYSTNLGYEFSDLVERHAVNQVVRWLAGSPILAVAANVAMVGLCVLLIRSLIRSLRGPRQQPETPSSGRA